MIRASRLAYRRPDGRQTIHEVDFHLPRGGFLAVLGENGAGKTTLLDLLMGFRRRTGGALEVLEGDPDRDPWGTRSRIAYLHRGRQLEFAVASRFATGEPSLAEAVVRRLTTDAEPLR